MKRQYMEPQMKVVRIKRMRMICASDPLKSVTVNKNSTMEEYEDFE